MKKAGQRLVLAVVFLGVMALLIPTYSAAFPTIKLGEESDLTFYGYLRNNTGMFLQNPQPLSQNSNDLATERTTLRGYTDWKVNNQFRFFSAIEFAYEPEYDVENGSETSRSVTGGPTKCCGKEYSEYNNINDILREAYLEWKPSKEHTIRIGRQIAIWGEALTTRVGDVIHPDNSRFSLAFANLEDTRIPSWMIRATHDFPTINSSFEWIVNPNLVQNYYRVNWLPTFSTLGSAGQRFAINPEERFAPPFSVTNPALGPPFSIPGVAVGAPFSRDWIHTPFAPGNGWVPTAIPSVDHEFPGVWSDLRGGFRTNTTLGGFNFGLSYFHTQHYNPIVKRGNNIPGKTDPFTGLPLREYTLVHPNIDIIGAYMNKQLPWPGVVRAEAIYVPNQVFNTFDPTVSDAVVRRDYVKYMIAYDLNGFFYFQWHKTAPFDVTLEHVGEWVPNSKNLQYIIYDTAWRTWNPSINMRISTNWIYNLIATELIVGWLPANGNSGLIMPAVKFMPPWLDRKLSFELKYIGIWGKNNFEGLGILRTKDMLLFTTQFDW